MTRFSDGIERLLAVSPAPDQGRHYLDRYAERFPDALMEPKIANELIAVFTHSHFLSEEVIQHPEWITEMRDLDRVLEAAELRARLGTSLPSGLPDPLALAAFR